MLLGQAAVPAIPASKLVEAVVEKVNNQAVDAFLDKLVPAKITTTTTASPLQHLQQKSASPTEVPVWLLQI